MNKAARLEANEISTDSNPGGSSEGFDNRHSDPVSPADRTHEGSADVQDLSFDEKLEQLKRLTEEAKAAGDPDPLATMFAAFAERRRRLNRLN